MPVDLEMFLSQTGASLFDYPPFVDNRYSFSNSYDDNRFMRSYSVPRSHIFIPKESEGIQCFNKKKSPYCFETDTKDCKKGIVDNKRKKVTFADDKGFRLVEIREIPGLPGSPTSPINSAINAKNVSNVQKCWKKASEHPPWTDSKLVKLLEENKVVLESAAVKTKGDYSDNYRTVLKSYSSNNEYVLQGTIKVKNLSYEKKVFVRITFDRWQSSIDVAATYLKPEKKPEKHYEYNDFTFSIDIPPSAFKFEVIEFCVGYFCNDKKYWDNNGGVNYRLVAEVVKNKPVQPCQPQNKKSNDRITLSLTENIERFSEIDSWNNFINNQPYW